MARIIKPNPTESTNTLSLRAGLINAAAPDGQMTILDLLDSYPNQKLHVDNNELTGANDEFSDAWENLLDSIEQAGVPVESGAFTDQSSLDLTAIDYDLLEEAAGAVFCGVNTEE